MKHVLCALSLTIFLSGCSFGANGGSTTEVTETPTTPAVTTTDQPVLDGNVHHLLITQHDFGTEEITVLKGETLILSVRNQLEEPINIVIDQLGVRSKEIGFGEVLEVTIPTDKPGEYSMYSSLGNQRNEGFTAVIVVDEGLLEE